MHAQQSTLRGATILVRFIARTWSILSVGFVLFMFVGEFIAEQAGSMPPSNPPTSSEWVELFFFPLVVSVGMLLAWRWEGLGGAVAVLGLGAFYLVFWLNRGDFPPGPWFLLVAIPGFLFLLAWALSRAVERTGGRSGDDGDLAHPLPG